MSHEIDTYLGGILVPDVLQPCQFYPSAKLSPESRLIFAVLEDALRTLAGRAKRVGNRLTSTAELARVVEVEHWMADTVDSGPFSFEGICSALNIDAVKLRLRAPSIHHAPYMARKRCSNFEKLGNRRITLGVRRAYQEGK